MEKHFNFMGLMETQITLELMHGICWHLFNNNPELITLEYWNKCVNVVKSEYPKRMLVWDYTQTLISERIVLGNFNGLFLCVIEDSETSYNDGGFYGTVVYGNAKELSTKTTVEYEATEEQHKAIKELLK
jgi:hypothetical protein